MRTFDREDATAREHNAAFRQLLANRLLQPVEMSADPVPMAHPYTVTASRFDPPVNYGGPLNPAQTWSIFVSDGFVNDQPSTILYQRTNDPRGWTPPTGYIETPVISNVAGPSPWIERDALDDPDDPPFLIMADPPTNPLLAAQNPGASDWTQIADTDRLAIAAGAFCGETDWDLELWTAHVILSAAPNQSVLISASLPPPALVNFRLSTSALLPTPDYGSAAGGWIELATLFLLRDPSDPYDSAQIQILPVETYDFWAMTVLPGGALLGLGTGTGGALGGLGVGGTGQGGTITPVIWTV